MKLRFCTLFILLSICQGHGVSYAKPPKASPAAKPKEPEIVSQVRSRFYETEPDRIKNESIYLYESQSITTREGENEKTVAVAKDNEGHLYSEQTVIYHQGAIQEYQLNNVAHQITAKVTVQDKMVHYDAVYKGKTHKDSDPLPENFVIGPAVSRFIQSHFSELDAGKEILFALGMIIRSSTINFKLFKVDGPEKEVKEGRWLKVKFRPTNALYSALAPSMHYFMDRITQRLVRYTGPTEYRKPGVESMQGMSGTILFSYP